MSQVAIGLIATANKLFDLKASSDIEMILIVVLFGIGTDYILFFLFRYRERLREGEEKRAAVAHALERAGEAIASAGGAVIVAFMALVLSSLGIFRSIGPALAIAVAVTLLAALTLVPALVTVLGRALFWPSKKYLVEPEAARFAAVGRSLVAATPAATRSPRAGCSRCWRSPRCPFNPTFDLGTQQHLGTAESAVALKTLEKGFPAGATDPTARAAPLDRRRPARPRPSSRRTRQALGEIDGVAEVLPGRAVARTARSPRSASTSTATRRPTRRSPRSRARSATRAHAAAPDGTEALVGGTTSVFVDFQAAMNRDYTVVFPVAAIVIMIILALLLRSLVAPVVPDGLGRPRLRAPPSARRRSSSRTSWATPG